MTRHVTGEASRARGATRSDAAAEEVGEAQEEDCFCEGTATARCAQRVVMISVELAIFNLVSAFIVFVFSKHNRG